jgi:8-amino-7-oxononanoate synthase
MKQGMLSGRRIEGAASARLTIDGRPYLNFFGSGYLALSQVPQLHDAARRAIQDSGAFSRQIPSSLGAADPLFDDLERQIGDIVGAETSVYCASGYLIGMIALAAIRDEVDALFLDEHAHFNLIDAARASSLPIFSFRHCDADALCAALRTHLRPGQRPLILTDGVFATRGNVAPLTDYAALARPLGGRLMVDESHAFGVVGDNGRGAAAFCDVDALSTIGATLSKAYCVHGAFLACSHETAERLRHAPVIRGASAGSPISAAVAAAALHYVRDHPSTRENLVSMAAYFRNRLRSIGIDVVETPSAIVSFKFGDTAHMRALQERLFEKEIFVYHSTYIGAGPHGIMRCAVFRDHTHEDIDRLIDALS